MASGTVTTTRKNVTGPVGLFATGTATGLQGDLGINFVRVAFSEPMALGLSGSRGMLSVGLVAATNAPTPAAPANDFCYPSIEFGFNAGTPGVVRWGVVAATRGIDGPTAADNCFITQSPYAPALAVTTGSQITADQILGAVPVPVHTFSSGSGVDNGILCPLTPDFVRVAFYVFHAGAVSGQWNLVWRLYTYSA